jgi:hypothetical protein
MLPNSLLSLRQGAPWNRQHPSKIRLFARDDQVMASGTFWERMSSLIDLAAVRSVAHDATFRSGLSVESVNGIPFFVDRCESLLRRTHEIILLSLTGIVLWAPRSRNIHTWHTFASAS